MIKVYIPFKTGFCIYPLICLPKVIKETAEEAPYFIHELAHFKRQKKYGVFAWLAKYLFDKRFRLQEELHAFRSEIQYKYAHGLPVNRQHYAATISNDYFKICTQTEAEDFIDKLILKEGKMVPKAGLEPAWIAPHAPQTCVSTSSTTSAFPKTKE